MIDNWAIVIPAGVAVTGWLYATRRSREQMRRQHTFNALLQVSFNKDYHENLATLVPFIKEQKKFPLTVASATSPAKEAIFILNHYEFIAAGIRTGDIDERLFKFSEKGTVIGIYRALNAYIYKTRQTRERDTVFEHIEWLYDRWCVNKPDKVQRLLELIISKPIEGKRR